MKRSLIIIATLILTSITAFAQKPKDGIEVLYFKANLSCCMARSCNALEADVQKVITTKYPKGDVLFTEVKLEEAANEALVKKYNAKSQTVIVVKTKRGKQSHKDISSVTRDYLRSQDYAAFEKAMCAHIEEIKKK
ncbi:MAG: hypothetical protein BWY22_02316 [Bacteroidetes bacterium ADurb.Bin217]|nr:MAG: hypothetical protein BWY22_02316 [Bacteroidetes bacterium ADurb.Bin217]